MSKVLVEIKSPTYPNFLKIVSGSGEVTLSIGALSDDELEQYAEQWKQELIEHAKSRRESFKFK